VQWRRRHNANVDKDAVITTVAQAVAAVAPEAKVALRSPMAAVVVEVIKSDAILAVLPRCEREEVGEGGG
jgi:tRNA(Ser,Leu) C12 N-acetylase TAN1